MSGGEPAVRRPWHSSGREGKREHDEAHGQGLEKGSDDDGAQGGEKVAEGARGQANNMTCPGGGVLAECGRRGGCGRWRRVGDDLDDAHAAAACSAAGDIEREDAGEELGPRDASRSGQGRGRLWQRYRQ